MSKVEPWFYKQMQLGFSYRMTDLQAALGLSQLQRLDDTVVMCNRHMQRYRELLADLLVQLLEVPDDVLSSIFLAVIRLQQATAKQHRQMFDGLQGAGISVQLLPHHREMDFVEEQFHAAEAYASSAISLPLFPGLSAADQERVAAALAEQLQVVEAELLV